MHKFSLKSFNNLQDPVFIKIYFVKQLAKQFHCANELIARLIHVFN